MYLAVRDALERARRRFAARGRLLIEVGGGSTSLTLLRGGEPNHSGVYALGSVRLRQQLDLRRHSQDIQLALLRRYIANIIEEIRLEIPLNRITHIIAIGGDVRFAAAQILDERDRRGVARDSARTRSSRSARRSSGSTRTASSSVSGCPRSRPRRWCRRCSCIARCWQRPPRDEIVVSDASLRAGMLLDVAEPGGRLSAEEFERQVLASAEALGQRYRLDRDARPSRRRCSPTGCSTSCSEEHGLGDRERLLLQVAALLHDVGIYVSLRAHHKHSQYILAASQIFGLSDEETAIVVEHRPLSSRGIAAAIAHAVRRARSARIASIVDKLAAILRVANALDAEHAAEGRATCGLVRHASTLDRSSSRGRRSHDGAAGGDRARRHVRRDVRPSAGDSAARRRVMTRREPHRRPVLQPRALVARVQRTRAGGGARSSHAAARAGEVCGDRGVEPGRVLHGPRRRRCEQAIDDG